MYSLKKQIISQSNPKHSILNKIAVDTEDSSLGS
jgi:hypothetical protein